MDPNLSTGLGIGIMFFLVAVGAGIAIFLISKSGIIK